MASWIVSRMKHIWPFSGNKTDDLKVSDSFVRSLPVHESTKQFVFALRDPDYPSSVVYLLATGSLSERSASDAECLVRAIKPKVVVAQIGPSALNDIREEEKHLNGDETCSMPTSWLGVLKGCFVEKIVLSQYESRAGSQKFYAQFLEQDFMVLFWLQNKLLKKIIPSYLFLKLHIETVKVVN